MTAATNVIPFVPRPRPNQETIDALEQLLALADCGELIGVAVVGILSGHRYFVDLRGRVPLDPLVAQAMGASLAAEFAIRHAQ